jgi:hypothetical protein
MSGVLPTDVTQAVTAWHGASVGERGRGRERGVNVSISIDIRLIERDGMESTR